MSSTLPYAAERLAAVTAVQLAARATRQVQPTQATTLLKTDTSPVTVADYAAQTLVSQHLALSFPDIPLVAEEDAQDLGSSASENLRHQVLQCVNSVLAAPITNDQMLKAIDRGGHAGGPTGKYWVLDPVDGTKGFLRGQQYAICLALVEEGQVKLGILGCPRLPLQGVEEGPTTGSLVAAVQGQGAYQYPLNDEEAEGKQIHCAKPASTADAAFCEGVEAAHSSHDTHAAIAREARVTRAPARLDSQCKYAVVARGDADIYLRIPTRPGYVEKIWDHAAGALIVQEAGGKVCDVDGLPLDFSRGRRLEGNRGIIATASTIHSPILQATQSVLAKI
ncbi:3',5'-bisphosphate nucleotidase [Piptocephalis cylindrospora]|uniref:3'(2'),5'-bisphosphate nucleotidase n=1 Tax=Piptocephalis cylindrospora TaxID=1907219 RepID=A0A4P9Y624_9FUNG|nr:3',5'-bisphosphate nucleotidase [Piptocephalis cylindrospora]|eukprot:RKP14222.1 3',5'-bisphosphate nucleotidase [Piptocephalis cylindrospora]